MWNNLKTTILLAAMTGLLLAIGQLWGGERGLVFALVLAGVMNLGSYFFSDKIALKMSGAKPIARKRTRAFTRSWSAWRRRPAFRCPRSITSPLIRRTRLPRAAIPATLRWRSRRGILDICDDEEIEGVLAHELGHVKNRDILISAVVATLAGAITLIARMVYWGELFGGFGGSRSSNRRSGGDILRARHDDCRAPRGHAHSARHFPLARVRGRRHRRAHYRQSPRSGAGARQD